MPTRYSIFILTVIFSLALVTTSSGREPFLIGWATVDITPDGPAVMRGKQVSRGVMDPLTATVLAMENTSGSSSQNVILISCDLQHITAGNRYEANMLAEMRSRLQNSGVEVHPDRVVMMATHTHMAPSVQTDTAYLRLASERIAQAAQQAW